MKKKFLTMAALAMVMTIMLAVSVFADVTISGNLEIYNGGTTANATTLTLEGIPADATIEEISWSINNDKISLSAESNSKTATITGNATKTGDARVSVYYSYKPAPIGTDPDPASVEGNLSVEVAVKDYALVSIEATCSTAYNKGQEIKKNDISVIATYTDDSSAAFTNFDYSPKTADPTNNTITVTALGVSGISDTVTVSVSDFEPSDLVTSFTVSIIYPEGKTSYEVGKYLSKSNVVVTLTYNNGRTVTTNLDDPDVDIIEADSTIAFSSGKYTCAEADITTSPVLVIKYGSLDAKSVKLNVTKPTEEKKLTGITVTTQPDKTFNVNDNFAFTGFGIRANYSDGTSRNITNADVTSQAITASPSVLSTAGTSVPVTLTFRENGVTVSTVIYVKVGQTVNVTGLSTSSSYKHSLYEDATVEVGEELDWDELFSYVYIKYKDSNGNNQYKKIRDDSELESWLGTSAKLYAIVDSKTGNKKDIVEEKDIDDGEVKLELCFEYGSVDDTYEFNVKVSEIGCTVTVCRSSSSSTKIGSAKTFDKLKDALEYLEDESDIIDDFGVSSTYEDSFVIKIKLGEDQDLGTFEFAPDHEHAITIDLADYDLELESDWIDFDDCEDLKVTITNSENYSSSDKDDVKSKMEYSDEDVTLVVDKNDTYTFSEGKIPGIYAVTVKSGITNGKVEANKTTVNHGADVKFTITPNSGYEISDVKVNSKSVTKDSEYDVNSKGVATYTLKKADKDIEITATFKKAAAAATEKEEEKKPASTPTWNNPFTDVSTSAQYYKAVEFVCSEGLFNGMTATKFEPTTTMTRAMFVTVLGRLAGINEMQYSGTSFTDVSKSDQQIAWAAPYIEWAVQKGITNGTGNGKFSPNEPITHQQMYVFMQRYADKIEDVDISTTGVTLTSIKDAYQIDSWAEDGVKFASKHGILITSGGKLTPTDNALRCELAMLLHGFCVKVLGQ